MYNPNEELINRVLKKTFDFHLYEHYEYNIVLDLMAASFQIGISQKQEKFAVYYFRVLYKCYMMCSEANKITFHNEFVKEWQHLNTAFNNDYALYYEKIIPNFQRSLQNLLNAVFNNLEKVQLNVEENLRYSIVVCPVTTLMKLVERVIMSRSPVAVDFTNNLCRSVSTLFYDREMKMHHTEHETDRKEPLLAVVIRRFISQLRCKQSEKDDWLALAHLIISFSKGEKPLLNCWCLLEVLLNELYTRNRTPTESVEMISGISALILDPDNDTPSVYCWALSMRAQPERNVLLTPSVVVMLLTLMQEYHESKESLDVIENAKHMIKFIGVRMCSQDSQFDKETKDCLVQAMRGMPWYVQYCVNEWHNLSNKRRVPAAIFEYAKSVNIKIGDEDNLKERHENRSQEYEPDIAIDNEEMFEKIHDESEPETSKLELPEAYLQCIMELGLFDPECAYNLLCVKTTVQFNPPDLPPLIENILKRCYNIKMGLHQIEHVRSVLIMILEAFDSSHVLDHKLIAESVLEVLPLPVINSKLANLTHHLLKSVTIVALAPKIAIPGSDTDRQTYGAFDQLPSQATAEMNADRERRRSQRQKNRNRSSEKYNNEAQKLREVWAKEHTIENPCYPQAPSTGSVLKKRGKAPRAITAVRSKKSIVPVSTSTRFNAPIRFTAQILNFANEQEENDFESALDEIRMGMSEQSVYNECSEEEERH